MRNDPKAVYDFYRLHLPDGSLDKTIYTADCPFCCEKGLDGQKRLIVFINPDGFFHGYFRCLNRCVPGGFPLWFTALIKSDPAETPGFDPEREPVLQTDFSGQTINQDVKKYHDSLTREVRSYFQEAGVGLPVLREMSVGYNGRYIVYPYFQEDGNCYSARCVFPDRPDDFFWFGNDALDEQFKVFNSQDIGRCENGTVVICEGEDDLLALKQLGLPGIAVPDSSLFESIDTVRLACLRTIFISTMNSAESEARARSLAVRIGYKARMLNWPAGQARNYSLWQLAKDTGKKFNGVVTGMARAAKAFSPFLLPAREYDRFVNKLADQKSDAFSKLVSGFPRLDEAIGGIHGLNVIGGAPKVGKSCFLIQIGTEMACRGIPVVYYDFENGRQKIYQRTLIRMSRIENSRLVADGIGEFERERYQVVHSRFKKMLYFFRVVNDRRLTPEIMRRHIDFIRHETESDYTVVIIDSLHKLPFKDLSERRTGIDAWLRQFESIRDEMNVSFLVISELSRGDKGSYQDTPHMGVFKGSGDIEYSADNALVLFPEGNWQGGDQRDERNNNLWLVASREHSPGLVAGYRLDFPYWGFSEKTSS